jgi:hypothetical protein
MHSINANHKDKQLDPEQIERLIRAVEQFTERFDEFAGSFLDHAPGGHDDVANAAAGALVLALSGDAMSEQDFCDILSAGAPITRREGPIF